METTHILDFILLSIVLGPLAGLGTQSLVRGVFVSLAFFGLALGEFLGLLGVHAIISFFFGQIIIMGSTYLFLRGFYPEVLAKAGQEMSMTSGKCH